MGSGLPPLVALPARGKGKREFFQEGTPFFLMSPLNNKLKKPFAVGSLGKMCAPFETPV